MWPTLEIIMFCGLPTTVATLPAFAPIASAIRNGTGASPACAASSSTSGVSSTHTVSLTTSADRTPESSVVSTSSTRGDRVAPSTRATAQPKKPASRRFAATTIMPNRSASVPMSIADAACAGLTMPSATMSVAPTSVAPARSSLSGGRAPRPSTRYVSRKTAAATSVTGPAGAPATAGPGSVTRGSAACGSDVDLFPVGLLVDVAQRPLERVRTRERACGRVERTTRMRVAVLGGLAALLVQLVRRVRALVGREHAALGAHDAGDRAGRHLEILDRLAARGAHHDLGPDRQRRVSAGHVRADRLLLVEAHPRAHAQARDVAHEPGVHVLVHRARLARGRQREAGRARGEAGAVVHHRLEHARHGRGGGLGQHLDRSRRLALELLAVLVHHLDDERRLIAHA